MDQNVELTLADRVLTRFPTVLPKQERIRRREELQRIPTVERLQQLQQLNRLYGGFEDYLCQYHDGATWCIDSTGVERDHIIPFISGGCDHDHNLRIVGYNCNKERGNYLDASCRFHCPTCRIDAMQCWHKTAAKYNKEYQCQRWRRHWHFNRYVSVVYTSHQGQDRLW